MSKKALPLKENTIMRTSRRYLKRSLKSHTKPCKEDDKKLDFERKNELRRKKLCFTCKEPWVPGHRCRGKGQLHYTKVTSDVDDSIDDTS